MNRLLKKLVGLLRLPLDIRNNIEQNNRMLSELIKLQDMQYRDLLEMVEGKKIRHNEEIELQTQYPVAYESMDHLNPLGTIQDNTRNIAFIGKCKTIFEHDLSYLDIGCSGGGLVFDFALNGYLAVGLEGSDHSLKRKRANWRTLPNNLFTCDITKPFELLDQTKKRHEFKIISCWEVLEHIFENDLSQLFENVRNHLSEDGYFVGSISKSAADPLHVTIRSNQWWNDAFRSNGLKLVEEENNPFEFTDYTRGIGGGIFDSTNYRESPDQGFHFVAKLSSV